MAMTSAKRVLTYGESTREPTSSPEELLAWWARPLPYEASDPRAWSYRPYRVKVIEKQRSTDGILLLTFVLVRHATQTPFKLRLPIESAYVWPDLPSTAQLADAGQYGFLFLSDLWAEDNNLSPATLAEAYAEPGNKWPFGGDAPAFSVARLIRAIGDGELRMKMFALLDGHASKKL
ncbi:hypothetical protein [Corallococcus caeni]|uniref:Uncharacterized protein n=1 Tax=Corallococcus caeni TaxID=3082388 RepID=A0ABQ6QQV5_9BACT|nr:hypothetical protein ASNO1_26330 [Corallococcus sp. NO1]